MTEPSSRVSTYTVRSPTKISEEYKPEECLYKRKGMWNLAIWFVIIAIIIYLLLLAFKPTFVQKVDPTTRQPSGMVNQVKAILTALIASAIIVLMIYLFRSYKD
jgi:uncharacterized membrane protein (DUF485 family)